MMRRLPFTLLAAAIALAAADARADEGMWMPSQLPQLGDALRAAGYAGDPAALADVTAAPLDAVVRVGGGTGSFVSGDGLVLTNHHVAYGVIQYNSSGERNLIDNGYTAADRAGELPASPDFRVLVTVGFDDVSDEVLKAARGRTGAAYHAALDAAGKRLDSACGGGAGLLGSSRPSCWRWVLPAGPGLVCTVSVPAASVHR